MFWKPKTREQQVATRTANLFTVLFSQTEFEFTELETVQILNNLRRKAVEELESRKSQSMEQAVNFNQKATEIKTAFEYLE